MSELLRLAYVILAGLVSFVVLWLGVSVLKLGGVALCGALVSYFTMMIVPRLVKRS